MRALVLPARGVHPHTRSLLAVSETLQRRRCWRAQARWNHFRNVGPILQGGPRPRGSEVPAAEKVPPVPALRLQQQQPWEEAQPQPQPRTSRQGQGCARLRLTWLDLQAECFTVSNQGGSDAPLDGWSVHSPTVGRTSRSVQSYTFPGGLAIPAGGCVTVHSGPTSAQLESEEDVYNMHLHWTRRCVCVARVRGACLSVEPGLGRRIWNNDGDVAVLLDSQGREAHRIASSGGDMRPVVAPHPPPAAPSPVDPASTRSTALMEQVDWRLVDDLAATDVVEQHQSQDSEGSSEEARLRRGVDAAAEDLRRDLLAEVPAEPGTGDVDWDLVDALAEEDERHSASSTQTQREQEAYADALQQRVEASERAAAELDAQAEVAVRQAELREKLLRQHAVAEADAEASRAAADMVVRAAELRHQLASRAVAAEDEARAAEQAASVVVAAMRHGEQEMIETLGTPARRLQTAIAERRRRWFRLGRQ
jgi:hypothetical protein